MKEYKNNCDIISLVREPAKFRRAQIKCSKDAEMFARNLYNGDLDIYESFFAIFLNRRNNTIGSAKIGQGGLSSVNVDVRLIMKYAIELLAQKIILVHNHPSGALEASDADIAITRKVKEASKYFDIEVLDHVILTRDGYFSFADAGLITY